MTGVVDNRWLFAAMGLTIQMHELIAYHDQPGKLRMRSWGKLFDPRLFNFINRKRKDNLAIVEKMQTPHFLYGPRRYSEVFISNRSKPAKAGRSVQIQNYRAYLPV